MIVFVTLSLVCAASLYKFKNVSIHVATPSGKLVYSKSDDINNDGKKEEISLYISGDEINGLTATFFVVGSSVVVPGHNPEDHFTIVDLGGQNKLKAIVMTDDGPSNDYISYFYVLGKTDFKKIGELQGAIDDMAFSGDGVVSTLARGKILDTWFYRKSYKLDVDGNLQPVAENFYLRVAPVNPMIMRVSLPVTVQPEESSQTFTVPEKSKVTILGCDNVSWCELSYEGIMGWFKVVNFDKISVLNLSAAEVFDGLSVAD